MVELSEVFRPHRRIGLDTSVFIYHIETASAFSEVANAVFHQLRLGHLTGIASVLALTELLVKPIQSGRRGLAGSYEALMRAIPNLAIVDIDAAVARRATALRATYGMKTADALHIATALENSASAFVTNDIRLRRVTELAVVVL